MYRLPVAKGRLSDHSVLKFVVNTSLSEQKNKEDEEAGTGGSEPVDTDQLPTRISNRMRPPMRYQKTKLPDSFMTSEQRLSQSADLIGKLLEQW